jgi:hypothetical protein
VTNALILAGYFVLLALAARAPERGEPALAD